MSKIVVQLDAYVIPDEHLVFKFSPGKTYRFYNTVKDAKTAFLDIRGLDALDDDPKHWDDKALLKLIAEDRWTRQLARAKRGYDTVGSAAVSRIDRRNLTFLKELVFDGKKGDLVVVPVDGYMKDVLIGEFTTDPGDVKRVIAKDGDYQHEYRGRPVRWLSAVEKRLFSGEMLKKLHNPNAIFVIGKSQRNEIYRHAYGNFVYDGEFISEFHTSKHKFTSEDSAVASMWFNGFDVLRHSMATNQQSSMSDDFYGMGLAKLPDRDAAELRININSPGAFGMQSKDTFAFALMAFFALSGCEAKDVINQGVTVQLKTVGKAPKNCQLDIENTVNGMATALGDKRLQQACDLGVRAEKDAQMNTSATLKSGAKKRK